jgi:TolA-binding protein
MSRSGPYRCLLPAAVGMAIGSLVAGCATQADLNDQSRKLQGMIAEQSRSIEGLRQDVERLRADMAGGAKTKSTPPARPRASDKDRLNALDKRLRQPESSSEQIGETLSPEGMSTEEPSATDQVAAAATGSPPPPAGGVPSESEAPQPVTTTPPPSPPTPPPIDADWKREVAQDRAVASTTNTPERAAYLAALDGLARGDCSKAGPRLYEISTGSGGGSPLSDDILYWEARCLAVRGDYRQALAKFRQVVSMYPRGDKAPAALWEEGRLLVRIGNTASARQALGKLIHDYPATAEATQARRKLTEIEH